MSKFSVVILLLLQAGTTFAQKYFAFIGSENRQPFYVRVDSEFHPSTAEGHLILSQLNDGAYKITIGFPGQTLPEQHYSFVMHGRDQAFELRPQGQDGLRLYDLQGNEWLSLQGGGGVGDVARSTGVKKDDAFSRMMAGVVEDTAVLYNTYAMEQALSDSPAIAATKPAAAPATAVPTTPAPATAAPSGATSLSSAASSGGATDTATAPRDTTTKSVADTAVAITSTVATISPAADSTHTASIGKNPTPGDTTAATLTTAPPVVTTTTTATNPATAAATNPAATSATNLAAITAAATVGSAPAPATSPADTTLSHAAGVMTHEPAPRFTDSGAAPLYRPIPKDTSAGAAPIPSAIGAPLYRKTAGVVKVSEKHGTKNVRLVYADHSGDKKTDTIVVIIPMDSPVARTPVRPTHAPDSTAHVPASRAHGPNADSPVVGAGLISRSATPVNPPPDVPKDHPADTPRRPAKTVPFVNSDCHDFATEYDVDKLRVKMLEAAKDDDRVGVARKTFKIKCFSTRQIRVLSEVFTSDAAKFRFFEAAWPFAADEHFHELSDLLADPVYNSKFKTMTHQQ